jgi:hypothetical protein
MPGFVNTQGPIPYTDFALPDVCLTPVPPSPAPVPIPYPNIGLGPTAIPTQVKMLVLGMPVHNLTTQKPISNGDNVGVSLGVLSGMVMGPVSAAAGSTVLFAGGPPATGMANPTKQNGLSPNAFGMTLSPSQPKLLTTR